MIDLDDYKTVIDIKLLETHDGNVHVGISIPKGKDTLDKTVTKISVSFGSVLGHIHQTLPEILHNIFDTPEGLDAKKQYELRLNAQTKEHLRIIKNESEESETSTEES